MPSPYAYHLTFELYATRDASEPVSSDVWRPGPGASIFDDLGGGLPPKEAAERQQTERQALPPTGPPAAATRDWRFGQVQIACFDLAMGDQQGDEGGREREETGEPSRTPAAALGPVLGGAGHATRGRYNPLVTASKTVDAGWGVVHLYREGSRTNDVVDDEDSSDGTVLCIPAVPSYMTPRDFLGFVGEAWSRDIRHYRMVLTSRTNRYLVLLKVRSAARARAWRAAMDGRVFNSMEAEVCHVAFIQSISFAGGGHSQSSDGGGGGGSAGRPLPPPTPSLIEMPTCPVCLERMDDTAGLMTILCQHVFHCTCLQTWKGSGCPVCRATNPSLIAAAGGNPATINESDNPYEQPFGGGPVSNLCADCDCADDLWICLICGNVGCGRYKGGHAKDHWTASGHAFSLELETQHVWDYAGDVWVHRLLRSKGDGKVVELPARAQRRRRERRRRVEEGRHHHQGGWPGWNDRVAADDDYDDYDSDNGELVPRAKLDNMGVEYAHLLTSQLESQRVYFEELVRKAADKAGSAAAAAEAAAVRAETAAAQLAEEQAARRALAEETVPSLERDAARERRRADKAAELARSLGQALQEEKKVSEGLLARVKHVQAQAEAAQEAAAAARAEAAELRETNRDLSMFISGQAKLRELEASGAVGEGEVAGGTAVVGEEGKGGVRKGKKRGK